jgi:6-phosphogluconolactonase
MTTLVYVSNAESKQVWVHTMDPETGELALVERVSVPGTNVPSPISMALAVSPDQRFLYAGLRSPPFPVSSFRINPRSGRLSYAASSSQSDPMAYIATDQTGRFLLSASYQGSKVVITPIDTEGRIAAAPSQVIPTEPSAHCVLTDATNRSLYATSLGGDQIMQRRFDAATGTTTPSQPGFVHSKSGAGPRHLAFHPNQRFLYCLNELDATIGVYVIDQGSGVLTEIENLPILPADFTCKPSAADLHFTPDGLFLYASERATNMIAGYRVDAGSGRLTPLGSVPTEAPPRGFAIDPRGRFLTATGQDTNHLRVHRIDGATGALTDLKQYEMGGNPNWVEIIDLP